VGKPCPPSRDVAKPVGSHETMDVAGMVTANTDQEALATDWLQTWPKKQPTQQNQTDCFLAGWGGFTGQL